MKRLLLICVLACLSACQTVQPPPPTPIAMSAAIAANNTLIQWVRSADTIVFRADISGGQRASTFAAKRDIPLCTIYGDNRVVWVNELGAFNIQVLYDRLPDSVIADFVAYLTVNERIYTYNSTPVPEQVGEPDAVVESIQINVNGADHYADAFSGWDDAWFSRVLTACRSLSTTPVLFEPSGGWMSVVEVPFDREAPLLTWDAAATGLDLPTLAQGGSAVWVTGTNAVQLWRTQNTQPSRFLYFQSDKFFAVALQVPGISTNSPPPG
ncbi:MAG: hypothetical protein U0670_07645 [Anaerolineae bacterium]